LPQFLSPLKSIDYGERDGRFLVAYRLRIAYLEGKRQHGPDEHGVQERKVVVVAIDHPQVTQERPKANANDRIRMCARAALISQDIIDKSGRIPQEKRQDKDEIRFDIGFFVVNTLFLIMGGTLLALRNQIEWLPFLVIEYTWALDNMRHNR